MIKKTKLVLVIEWDAAQSPPPDEWDWAFVTNISPPESIVVESWEELDASEEK